MCKQKVSKLTDSESGEALLSNWRKAPRLQIRYKAGQWQTYYPNGKTTAWMSRPEIIVWIVEIYNKTWSEWTKRDQVLMCTSVNSCATMPMRYNEQREYLKRLKQKELMVEKNWLAPESVKTAYEKSIRSQHPLDLLLAIQLGETLQFERHPVLVWRDSGEFVQL